MVALSDRIVTAPEASLAPDLEAGDTALYEPRRGEVAEVKVASVDTSTWCVILYFPFCACVPSTSYLQSIPANHGFLNSA